MKYLWKLILSLKEIFLLMFLQYGILFFCFIVFGPDKTIIIGSVLLILLQIIYVVYKGRGIKFSIDYKSYIPLIMLGVGVSATYNMIIFKLGLASNITTDVNILFSILCTGIIGPIFEEFLFRYDLTGRLSLFNNKKWVVILLSSTIFALCHSGITTIIYAFIVGIINTYIYTKDKDIIKPIIVHISMNTFVIFLTDYNLYVLLIGILLIFISTLIIKSRR